MADLRPIKRGDTKTYALTFKDKDTGAAINIQNHVLFFTLKQKVTDLDGAAVFQKQVTIPADADALAGKYSLVLTSTETASIALGVYFYDLQKVIAGSPPVVNTIAMGKVRVSADITISTA